MNKYVPQEWYSVIWKNTGKKYCDCGWEKDAMNIVSRRPDELTYIKSGNNLMGQVIDVEVPKALPTNEIVMADGYSTSEDQLEYIEIGGQKLATQQKQLPNSELEPLNLEL